MSIPGSARVATSFSKPAPAWYEPVRPPGLPDASKSRSAGMGAHSPQVAEPGVRRVVPEDAVAAAGDEEGHDHGRVVLPELEVVPLDVHQAELVLAQAVERLVLVLVPLLAGVEGLLPLDLGRHERAPALLLDEDRRGPRVEERDPPRGEVHADLHLRGGEGRLPAGVGALDADRVAPADPGGQARPVEEGGLWREGHAHDVVGAEGHLQVAAAVSKSWATPAPAEEVTEGGAARAAPAAITMAIRFIGLSRKLRCSRSRTPRGCARPPWPDSRRRRRGRAGRRGRSARRRFPRRRG